MDLTHLIATFFVGIFASFIGAMVGSGGLINIPFLMFLGLPPHVAIATNKFGAVGLKLGAIAKFWKTDYIKWKYFIPFSLLSIVAAFAGTQMLLLIDKELLSDIVVVLLLLVLPILFVNKHMGIVAQDTPRFKQKLGYAFYFLVQVFSAFFGGGSATIIIYVLMYFLGFTIIEAGATHMLPSLILNSIALVIYGINGIIAFELGFVLFLGMVIGGWLGASFAVKKGNALVKVIFVGIVLVLIVKILAE